MCVIWFSGADVFLGKEIHVRFVSGGSEFARCPVAHTCGCTLEVPDSYATYNEMKSEFNSVLNSKIWVMDIV